MERNKNLEKKWAEIVAKAWMDSAFKERLLREPEKVFKEMGVFLPNGFRPKIVENNSSEIYLVLPKKPGESFSEEELRKVAAGLGDGFCFICS